MADAGVIQPNTATPTTPASGKQIMYGNTDKYPHNINEAGIDHIQLGAVFTSNVADFTLANSSSAQSPFEAARDVFTVAGSTTYKFELLVQITGMGGTTRTTALEFDAGTATLTSISYFGVIWPGAAQTITTTVSAKHCIAATAQVLDATRTTAAATIKAEGFVRINAAGTFIPQIKFSADPTGTIISEQDSYFLMYPLGSNTVGSVGSLA